MIHGADGAKLSKRHGAVSVLEYREMGVLPEGYSTLRSTLYVAEKLHVSVPLAKGLWDVIDGRQTADRFITSFIHDFVE